jgi:hypothetical protein
MAEGGRLNARASLGAAGPLPTLPRKRRAIAYENRKANEGESPAEQIGEKWALIQPLFCICDSPARKRGRS